MPNELIIDILINEKKDILRSYINKAVEGGISVEQALKSIIKILYQVSGGSIKGSNMLKMLNTIEFLTYALNYYEGEARDNLSKSVLMLTRLLYHGGDFEESAILYQ